MQSKCKAMQSKFTRLVFVLILSNCLIINKTVVSFRYAVFIAIYVKISINQNGFTDTAGIEIYSNCLFSHWCLFYLYIIQTN